MSAYNLLVREIHLHSLLPIIAPIFPIAEVSKAAVVLWSPNHWKYNRLTFIEGGWATHISSSRHRHLEES